MDRGGDSIEEKKLEYNVPKRTFDSPFFLNPGLLEIDRNTIELNYFDPRGVDLSSFKAELVDNDIPFKLPRENFLQKMTTGLSLICTNLFTLTGKYKMAVVFF